MRCGYIQRAGLWRVAQTSSDWAPRSIVRGSGGVRFWLATLSDGLATMRGSQGRLGGFLVRGLRLA